MTPTVSSVFAVLAVLASVHTVLLMMTQRWLTKNVVILRREDGFPEYVKRVALVPWYVRYAARMLRLSIPSLIPPTPPEVALIDPDGIETKPNRIEYAGIDAGTGLHRYEAWFPSSAIDPRSSEKVTRLPGYTMVSFRYEP